MLFVSNLIAFQKCPCSWQPPHQIWQNFVNNQTRFVQNQNSNRSFQIMKLELNIWTKSKSYIINWFLNLQSLNHFAKKHLECERILLFVMSEVWSFEFGAVTTTWLSQIKVNMNIFRVISPSLRENTELTKNLAKHAKMYNITLHCI